MATGESKGSQRGDGNEENVGFNNMGDGFEKVINEATSSTSETSSAIATASEINQVAIELMKMKKLPMNQMNFNKVIATTAHLVQIGATSPKYSSTRMITDYGIEIKVGELRDACNKSGITVRKYARGIRDQVIILATKYQIEGNLAKGYKLENPSCDRQDLPWVADFQTFSDNPSMPDNVRTWLLENYKSRFRPSK
uniref:Uncharacterized protein n=1 Tax=Pseudopediastrum sp. CL0201VA TaxID=2184484 RepID=A0A2U8GJL7_9CHLO|nr:hypothetical protein [Pseudopediastrum sp. CL0201VA]AWI68887.1 hypothetical protein [Pseudopediastrum sp. CL0201VA]